MVTAVEKEIGRCTIKIREAMKPGTLTIHAFFSSTTNQNMLSRDQPEPGSFVSCTGKLLTMEADQATVKLQDIVSLRRMPLPMPPFPT